MVLENLDEGHNKLSCMDQQIMFLKNYEISNSKQENILISHKDLGILGSFFHFNVILNKPTQ
jgi:hypothetical protein